MSGKMGSFGCSRALLLLNDLHREGNDFSFDGEKMTRNRAVVEEAVREVCLHRKYRLRAINVGTKHVHTVVSAAREPEPILDAFEAHSTSALRRADLLNGRVKPWARHRSTIYLGKKRDVEKAVEYVLLGQEGELPTFD